MNDLGDVNLHDRFRVFLEEDYFQLLRKTCEAETLVAEKMSELTTMLFEPMVDPAFEASPTEVDERKSLLRTASTEDHTFAVQVVTTQYAEVLESRSSAMRRIMPTQAPPKFAAPRYYAALWERVKKNNRVCLEEDYFQLLLKTCEAETLVAEKMSELTTILFQPMVDPAFEASPTEVDERKSLLRKHPRRIIHLLYRS